MIVVLEVVLFALAMAGVVWSHRHTTAALVQRTETFTVTLYKHQKAQSKSIVVPAREALSEAREVLDEVRAIREELRPELRAVRDLAEDPRVARLLNERVVPQIPQIEP